MSKISERIKQIIDNQEISIRTFEASIGCAYGTITRVLAKDTDFGVKWLEKTLEAYPSINPNWLVKGEGSMYIDEKNKQLYIPTNSIPLYSDLAFAGSLENAEGSAMPEGFLSVPGFEEASLALYVHGNSMVPHYYNGDIVVVKEIMGNMGEWPWNKVALVVTKSGRYLKYLHRSNLGAGVLLLVSSNPEVPPIEVNVKEVIKIFAVLGRVCRHEI